MIPPSFLTQCLVAFFASGPIPATGADKDGPRPLPEPLPPRLAPSLPADGLVVARQERVEVPAPPPVSPGGESEARQRLTPPPPGASSTAESSARELQPGAGETYMPPPPIPPAPPSMLSIEAAQAEAAGRAPLTLDQIEDLALKNNPTLVQARAQVETGFGTAIQAGLWPNPTLHYLAFIGQAGTAGLHEGFFSQPLITAGKRRLNRARFLESTKAEEWNAMAVEYQVLNDVRIHYFHTLGVQAIVEIQKEILQNFEDEVVTVRESYNLGIHNRRDLHEANAALQTERLNYLRMQNMLRRSFGQLMAIVGVQEPFTRLAGGLEGDTTPLEWDASLDRIMEQSPLMQAAYAYLRFQQVGLKLQRVEPWPNVSIVGGAGYHFPTQRPVAQAEVRLMQVPLWNWNQGNIRKADAQVLRQQAEIRRVSLDLQKELANTYRSYLTALQHVENDQRVILPELRRAYELALDSYESDRNTWGDVLMAQRKYYMARAAYVTHAMAWREAEVLIVGFLLHGGLMPAPPPPMPSMGPNIMPMPHPPTPPFRLPAMMEMPAQAPPERLLPTPNLMMQQHFIPPAVIAPPP